MVPEIRPVFGATLGSEALDRVDSFADTMLRVGRPLPPIDHLTRFA